MRWYNFTISLVLWALIFAGVNYAFGHEGPMKNWLKSLKNAKGENCCDMSDGYPAEAENDTAKGHWRVKIKGEWIVVPDEAVLTVPNRIGYPMVWWYPVWESSKVMHPQIRCFLPGALL